MTARIDQATIIILDIGKNVSIPDGKNALSFFQKAQECTSRIIERKIISQEKNLLGLILLGTKATNNPIAEQVAGSFRHINIYTPLQKPTWSMIRNLPETATKYKGNWFDALIVAADHFKNGISNVKIANKKIILITNFQATSDLETSEEMKEVLNGFNEEGYEVDVFGPDIYSDDKINPNILLARQFVEETNGATATFDYIMRYLLFHRKKAVNPTPWNVDLSIGPNIKIPVSSYIRIKNEPVVKKWLKAVKDPVTNTASSEEAILKNKMFIDAEDQSIVDSSLGIKGYEYGQQYIPFADCDKNMLYQSGPKTLSVYGFTRSDNISWQNFNSDGMSYIFGRKGDIKAQKAITCLVHCLIDLNLVGIVRRVNNNGNAPKMYALMPVMDSNNYVCLSMVGICYKEDIKNMTFPPTNLKKYDCTDEQVNLFKDLIKAMDLTKAYDELEYDDTEAFPIAQTVSPSDQYVLDCIAFRAMNPGLPLPEPNSHIKTLFKRPQLIEKRSMDPLEKIKKMFTLNKVETNQRNKKNQNFSAIGLDMDVKPSTSLSKDDLNDMPKIDLNKIKNYISKDRIGTIDPISDYENMKKNGICLDELASQMTEAMENMIIYNVSGDYTKVLKALAYFREECVKNNPTHYNNWLKHLKFQLADLKKKEIVDMINASLNFILGNENSISKLISGEDSEMYEYDTVPMLTEIKISTEINDLFDNM